MKWWKKKHKITDMERKFNRLTDRFTALEANIYVISKEEEHREKLSSYKPTR